VFVEEWQKIPISFEHMKSYYEKYSSAFTAALAALEVTNSAGARLAPDEAFGTLCQVTGALRQAGRKQFMCGNGASSTLSNHMALDWSKNAGIPTMSCSDSAILTAVGNDIGYEEVFSAPIRWYAERGDQLVTISSSGNSPNILRALEAARELGLSIVTFSGLRPDNSSRKLGDLNFYVPAKTYGIVESIHQILLHLWLDRFLGIQEWARSDAQNMRRGEFKL
jgi:D-sedoheptulose 7-phosphate isomerase